MKSNKVRDFATLDFDRMKRCGFPEFVYGAGKKPEQVVEILKELSAAGEPALATRISHETAQLVQKEIPDAEIDLLAGTAFLPSCKKSRKNGLIVICSAGTSDLPVAREAEITARACGFRTEMITDVGVAGIHRLLKQQEKFRRPCVVIAVAGMEGALPSVIGGLTSVPVIAVPSGVGYGASFNGLAALLAMLNSCAGGISVVNIGNGFGAALAAVRILQTFA